MSSVRCGLPRERRICVTLWRPPSTEITRPPTEAAQFTAFSDDRQFLGAARELGEAEAPRYRAPMRYCDRDIRQFRRRAVARDVAQSNRLKHLGQRCGMGDKLAASGMLHCGGDAHFRPRTRKAGALCPCRCTRPLARAGNRPCDRAGGVPAPARVWPGTAAVRTLPAPARLGNCLHGNLNFLTSVNRLLMRGSVFTRERREKQ